MKHKPAMYALLRLHAYLGGKIKESTKESTKLAGDMRHVEAVIRMLEPGYDVAKIAPRRRYGVNPWFKRGECFRRALGVLRAAEGPLTTREIVVKMLERRGVVSPSRKVVRDMVGAVHASLRNHEGGVVIVDERTSPVRWRLS